MKYLGLDYGTKRIGVSHSDESGTIAFPLEVVASGPKALTRIADLIKEHHVETVVIGESRNFSNEPNRVMEAIEQFKKDLTELTRVSVVYELEFLTSAQAARQGQDKRGVGGGDKNDAAAAALILQSYLDRMKNHGTN